jgi:hypothetical protein
VHQIENKVKFAELEWKGSTIDTTKDIVQFNQCNEMILLRSKKYQTKTQDRI